SLGLLVVRAPAQFLRQRLGHHLAVDRHAGIQRVPGLPGESLLTIRTGDPDRESVLFGYVDPGRKKRLPGDLGPVSFVPLERLTRPCPGDQHPSATAPERLLPMSLGRTRSRNHAFLGTVGLDP